MRCDKRVDKQREVSIVTQIERIQHMETALDDVSSGLAQMSAAVDRYHEILPKIRELSAYYGSPDWNQDFDDDREGNLPADLKRGVLSEDAVYDALNDHRDMLRQLLDLVSVCIRGGDIG